jgi:MerR family transcriptional regulator, thiopeptide resistance regulator
VRTLHHHDAIGLLTPSMRTGSGHRRYAAADLRRLHRILALRSFGFPLADIGRLLDGPTPDTVGLVRAQLTQAEERLVDAARLRDHLRTVLQALTVAAELDNELFLQLIEVMTAVDRTYTPEDLERMNEQRQRATADLTPQQRAEMDERRRQFRAQLSPEQLADMHRRRANGGAS